LFRVVIMSNNLLGVVIMSNRVCLE
jgi:hypothetical protein